MTIEVEPWNPNRPYLTAFKKVGKEGFWPAFEKQEAEFGTLPAFYLDTAEFLFRQGRTQDAIDVALNALELPTADTTTLTILADRLMRYGDEARAFWLYERLVYLEPDLPQPRRNLALALIERAERAGKAGASQTAQRADYLRALTLLSEIVAKTWSADYDGIELISLMEANRVVPRLRRLGVTKLPLDDRFIALLDVDVRVTLEWNTNITDMDLWVDEPDGERAIYSNPKTKIGGRLSHDMTQGYGPEEYLLRKAPSGTYVVHVNIYRQDSLNPNGAVTIRVHLYRAYGRADESVKTLEVELKPKEDGPRLIGTIKVGDSR